ncbi:MAG: ATP-utilizing enzyme of the PP-loop superfamily [Ignavibacteriae bacterium]|nr:MAG: ATP-utilizing enzyme of the PP-loop superfamily [Ignavibacteriota bacterium]
MDQNLHSKYIQLQFILHEMESVVIGFSGGVDSTLLLKVAVDTLGSNVIAVIGKSETYPSREYEEAEQFVRSLGAPYEVVYTQETDNLKFKENPPDRCYYCKTELFTKLSEIAQRRNIKWIADGTNVDDLGDFRPGLKAVKENNVRSPLLEAGFTKNDIRELSRILNLPTWDKQSFACLSSRFPYWTRIEPEKLKKIDIAETFLRDNGFKYFRVRHHDDKTLRIEVGGDEIYRFLDENFRITLVKKFKELDFVYITLDLEGFRSGSMNEVLDETVKQKFKS